MPRNAALDEENRMRLKMSACLKSEIEKWAKLTKAAGMQPE